MHRKSRFLVGLTAAVITFGCFWFTMGPEHFNRGHRFCQHEHCCMQQDQERHCCESNKTINAEKVIIVREVAKTDSVK